MRIFYLVLTLLLLDTSLLFSQKSPKKINQLSDKDTNKVSQILKLAYDLQYKKPKQSLQYAQIALKLAKKQNYLIGKLNAQIQFINSAFENKKIVQAKKLAEVGLKEAKKIKKPYYISMFYYKLAESLSKLEKKEKSINTYIEAVKYLDKLGKKAEIFKMKHLNRIGSATQYLEVGRDTKYWQESIDIAKKYKIKNIDLGWSYNRIASMYGISFSDEEKKNTNKIIPYLDSSLQVSQSLLKHKPENREALILHANSLTEKAFFYYSTNQSNLGLKYARESLKIRLEVGEQEDIKNSYYNLGQAYERASKIDSALFYTHKLLELQAKTSLATYNIYEILGRLYGKKGNNKKATFYLIKTIDGLKKGNRHNLEEMSKELHLKYQDEKKEAQIKAQKDNLKQQQTQNFLLLLGIAFILFFALYLFYTNHQRLKKNKILASQKEEIETQAKELQVINEKLKALDGFKQDLTNMIAHDLKNPLNTIIGLSQTEYSFKENQQSIYQSGHQMLNMVTNMLDVHKFEEAKMELEIEESNLQQLIKKAINSVSFLLQSKDLEIINQFEANYLVEIDQDLIFRVLVNLLTNAIKYSPNNSQITVGLEKLDNDTIKVFIEDKGKGVSKTYQNKLFNKFSQIEAKKLGKIRSTGLGLAFCKMAIEAHQGQIGVISEAKKGACFWFTLKTIKELNPVLEIDESITKHLFSEEEKAYILPYIDKLKNIEIFETSKITETLANLRQKESKSINKWVEEIEIAVYNYNEMAYQGLINSLN